MAEVRLTVNGQQQTVDVEPDTPLLYVLRNDLRLVGPRFGCGLAQCGSCTVLLGDQAIRSCVTPVSQVGDQEVTTVEGLGTIENPGPLQQAFIDEQAAQCGFCIPGMIMSAEALFRSNPEPGEEDIRSALTGNLCRCGTHLRILRAVQSAAGGTA